MNYSLPRFILLGAFVTWLMCAQALAQAPGESHRPRVGLVLSGGGARGVAHVGVLKVLEDMHVPVDAIAGTSMGAVVGGLYASGMRAEEIERLVDSVNWQDAFQDRPQRAELGFRRKQDDRNFLVRYSLGLQKGRFTLPKGLVQGQKLHQLLRRATLQVADVQDFDQLPIPFRALATDLETGEAVVMSSGDLVTAMRASMSAPGVFSPVERDGRLLVDGGLVHNLPVDIAREMNVDVLIVVDVSFPLYSRKELDSPLEITNQAFAILVRQRTLEQLQRLQPNDVVITPALGRYSSADFSRVSQSLRAGVGAAREAQAKLAALALSETDYLAWQHRREPQSNVDGVVQFVRTDEASERYEPLVEAAMNNVVGKPLNKDRIGRRLEDLYALDRFETIDYSIVEEQDRQGLEFHLKRKSWGPNYVRMGLNLEDDFEGNSRYNAALRFIATELNARGGEWLTDVQIGDNPRVFTEFYQPLTWNQRYFIAPQIEWETRSLYQLDDNDDRIAQYRVRTLDGGLDIGREFHNWGELRVGLRRGEGRSRVLVGDPTLPTGQFNRGGYFTRFSYDKLDSIFFPRHGQQFELEWRAERNNMGADAHVDTVETSWLVARSFDRHTLIFWTDIGTTVDDVARPQDLFTLGGFFNLSGLASNTLSGPHYGIGRLIYYRQIGRRGTGVLDFPTYAGISLEAGNVWQNRSEASFGDLRTDGSLFLGVDTFLGPVYLGAGLDEGGNHAFYLFLGRTF
ncbi:MAG TPA: patatin-like phospholipase family protein [Steroidobacteraceae bacterium]|nr:patatin-like phospholipase family protein [Steroidobacteraceae bacterium]